MKIFTMASFKKPLTYLPETIQSPTNKILFNQVFEKFLSKAQRTKDTRIVSLDPMVKKNDFKVDSISQSASPLQPIFSYSIDDQQMHDYFEDIMLLAKRYNVDIENFDTWGKSKSRNFLPPIDYDKFTNFSKYVWVTNNTSAQPNYVVIKNPIITDIVNIIKYRSEDTLYPSITRIVDNIVNSERSVIVSGNYVENFTNSIFTITNITFNTTLGSVTTSLLHTPSYNTATNETTFIVALATNVNVNDIIDIAEAYDIFGFGMFTNFLEGNVNTTGLNDWQKHNLWVHQDNLPSGVEGVHATIPIIEFSDLLELNTHSTIKHSWSYRKSINDQWVVTTASPTLSEISAGQQELTNYDIYDYSSVDYPQRRLITSTNIIAINSYVAVNGVEKVWLFDGVGTIGSSYYASTSNTAFNAIKFNSSNKKIHICHNLIDVIDITSTNTIQYGIVVNGNASSLYHVNDQLRILPFFSGGIGQLITVTGTCDTTTIPGKTIIPIDQIGSVGRLTPQIVSSLGDSWIGFQHHWKYNFATGIKPCKKPSSLITTFTKNITVDAGNMVPIITTNGTDVYVSDYNTVRVYINGTVFNDFTMGSYDGITFTPVYEEHVECNAIKFNKDIIVDKDTVITFVYGPIIASDIALKDCVVAVDEGSFIRVNLSTVTTTDQKITGFYTNPLFNIYNHNDSNNVIEIDPIITYKNDTNGKFVPELNEYIAHDTFNHPKFYIAPTKIYLLNNILTNCWQSSNNYEYTPKLVNENNFSEGELDTVTGTIVPALDLITGFWEIPPYVTGNTLKVMDDTISSDDLSAHLANMITNGINSKSNVCIWDIPFDRFISTMSSKSILMNVVEYQKQQHLDYVNDVIRQTVYQLLDVIQSPINIVNLNDEVYHLVRQAIKEDDARSIFSDSVTGSEFGGFNVIPTAAVLGLTQKQNPTIINNIDGVAVYDHQGSLLSSDNTNLGFISVAKIARDNKIPRDVSSPVNGSLRSDLKTIERFYGGTWHAININDVYSHVLYRLEMELYNTGSNIVTLNQNFITINNSAKFDNINRASFLSFCSKKDPRLSNTNIFFDKSDAFTWNYLSTNYSLLTTPRAPHVTITSNQWGVSYKTIYKNLFGTATPHLEPWILQGYANKPTWWDASYQGVNRRWSTQMWLNIKSGTVPIGNLLPSNIPSTGAPGETYTYDRVCVNITNTTTNDGYQPDDLLPPYWSNSIVQDAPVAQEALFSNIYDIVYENINAPYNFGDGSLIEFEWLHSVDSIYDTLKAHFMLNPIDVCNTMNPISNFLFNGVYYYDNESISSVINDRIEPYYIQNAVIVPNTSFGVIYYLYARSKNTSGDIKNKYWSLWTKQYSIPLNTIIEESELELVSNNSSISNNDFSVVLKKREELFRYTFNNLVVRAANINSRNLIQQQRYGDLLSEWEFIIDTPSFLPQTVSYYDSLFSDVFCVNLPSSEFVLPSGTFATKIQTGWPLTFFADGILGSDFEDQSIYYAIVTSPTTFKIARTPSDAIDSIAIELSDVGNYTTLYVGFPSNDYVALNGASTKTTWYQFAPAKDVVKESVLPIKVTGLYGVLNFIDGYSSLLKDRGIYEYNSDYPNIDDSLNREQNWQYEKELLIASLFKSINDKNLTTSTRFYVTPFKQDVWVKTNNGLLTPLNDTLEHADMSYVYDINGNIIKSNELVVYRDDVSRIQTSQLPLGGGNIICYGFEHSLVFNNEEYIYKPFTDWFYQPFSLSLVRLTSIESPNVFKVGGFYYDNKYYNNIEDLTINASNYYTDDVNFDTYMRMTESLGFSPQNSNVELKGAFKRWQEGLNSKGSMQHLGIAISSNNVHDVVVDEFWAIKSKDIGASSNSSIETANFNETNIAWLSSFNLDTKREPVTHNGNDVVIINATADQHYIIVDKMYPVYEVEVNLSNAQQLYAFQYVKNNGIFITDITCDYVFNSDFITVVVDGALYTNSIVTPNGSSITVTINFTIEEQLSNHDIKVVLNNTVIVDYVQTAIDKILVDLTGSNFTNPTIMTVYGIRVDAEQYDFGVTRDDQLTYATSMEPYEPQHNLYGFPKTTFNFIQDQDPSVYNVEKSETVTVSSLSCNNMLGKIWVRPCKDWAPYTIQQRFGSLAEQTVSYGHTGKLSEVEVYEWVRSDVTPDVWHGYAIQRQNNTLKETIITKQYNGEPLYTIQRRTRATVNDAWGTWTDQLEQSIDAYTNIFGSNTINVSSISQPNDIVFVCIDNVWTGVETVSNTGHITINVPNNGLPETKITVIKTPTLLDDTDLVQYRYAYNYTQVVEELSGFKQNVYYFWAKNTPRTINISNQIIEPLSDRFITVYRDGQFNYGVSNKEYHSNTTIKVIAKKRINAVYDKPHTLWNIYAKNSGPKISSQHWNHVVASARGTLNGNVIPYQQYVDYDDVHQTNTRIGLNDGQVILDVDDLRKLVLDVVLVNYNLTSYTRGELIIMIENDLASSLETFYSSFSVSLLNMLYITLIEAMLAKNNSDIVIKTSMLSINCEINIT